MSPDRWALVGPSGRESGLRFGVQEAAEVGVLPTPLPYPRPVPVTAQLWEPTPSSTEYWHVCVNVESKANSTLEPGLRGMACLIEGAHTTGNSGDFLSRHEQLHQRGKPCC